MNDSRMNVSGDFVALKTYHSPEVVCLGPVRSLVQGGASTGNDAGTTDMDAS